jgi:osmotically-inducible protein OsmY
MLHIYYNQLLFAVSFLPQWTDYHTVERFAAVDLQSLRMSRRGKRMARIANVPGAAAAMVWLALLPGCAVYKTYEKCGFAGCPDDQRITRDVEALFRQHPALEPPNLIEVQTLDHVVYLNGLVNTDLERQLAESVAAGARGVARVINSIGLSGGAL